jgi:hypothetical protein
VGLGEASTSEPSESWPGSCSLAYLHMRLDLLHCEQGQVRSQRSLRWRHELQLLTGLGRFTALPAEPGPSKTIVVILGVMLATGAGRSGSGGNLEPGAVVAEMGVVVEAEPGPLSRTWAPETGVAMPR